MKWRYFVVAVLVVGYAMLAVGAPLIAVLAGAAFAAVMNLKQLGTRESWTSKKRSPIARATNAAVAGRG